MRTILGAAVVALAMLASPAGAQDRARMPVAVSPQKDTRPDGLSFWNRPSVRLGEVPVVKSDRRAVALRFTLAGTPPPMIHTPTTFSYPRALTLFPTPLGQTLFSVHVDLVGLP